MLALLLVGIAMAQVVVPPGAGGPGQPKKPQPPLKPDTEIIQEFPTNGVMETAWKVNWAQVSGYGLYIKDAWFKRGPNDPWMQILGDARISEIFVPYHRGSPRFWDVSYNFPLCIVGKEDAGPFGKLLRSSPTDAPRVVQEIRDRGIIWKDHTGVRRGQALVLWGCLEAANYRYIIEYSFQDDGAIQFRMGSTGRNYGGSEYEPHMHAGLWRIDVNLNGPGNNSVYVMEHIEPSDPNDPKKKGTAKTVHTEFNGGFEGALDWNAEKFTMLRIVNTKKKSKRGEYLAYDLMPLRMGNSRHYGGKSEECTQHDYWVTKARPNELIYKNLPDYIKDPDAPKPPNGNGPVPGERIMDTDVVVWHSAPMHHEPRLEDGEMVNGRLSGVTHVMWAGFLLRPRELFDRTPLYYYGKK
jgi:primary-amine oxidase